MMIKDKFKKSLSLIMAISFILSTVPCKKSIAISEQLPEEIAAKIQKYNVVYNIKGISSLDSMPIGNGDMAANVWVENNGDLVLYLSKGDSYSEATRLLKIGRVRVNISPNPFANDKPFKQELNLTDGAIYITAGDVGNEITIKVWVDANNPVMNIEATGTSDFTMKSTTEIWRNTPLPMNSTNLRSFIGVHINTKEVPTESADVVLNRDNKVVWYHRDDNTLYNEMLEYQGLTGYDARYPDPYKNRTFGASISGDNMVSVDNMSIQSQQPGKNFNLAISSYTAKTQTVQEWEDGLNQQIANAKQTNLATNFENHVKWWHDFWNRSWIFITGDADAENVTRGYLLNRFSIACQGRNEFPIKFNGGLFTMPSASYGDDYRDWGSMVWHQNTRLVYWPLIASGDFDMLMPYFDMYKNQLPLRKEITKQFFGYDGAYYPEQIFPYGADGTRDKMKWAIEGTAEYTTYHWQNGFEVVNMMLDYYSVTKDDKFASEYIVPIAQELIRFYYQKYVKDGVMTISPSNALETYWNCTNPTDHIAGLKFIIPRLEELPAQITNETLLTEWKNCYNSLPPLPFDSTKQAIKPAETYGSIKNVENPELYSVFPYRIYGVGKPDLQIGINTFNNRKNKSDGCWYQNGVQAAYLGLVDAAKKNVVFGLTNKAANVKFPAFWAKGNDEVPDYDNGGQASLALQTMLMQCEGQQIYLLPTWPKGWNVDFKLHAFDDTVVRAVYQDGKIVSRDLNKPERAGDIILPVQEYTFETSSLVYDNVLLNDTATQEYGKNWTIPNTVATDDTKSIYNVFAATGTSKITSVGDVNWTNYNVSTTIRTSSTNTNFGGGVVFRYIDDKNFATFRLSGTGASNKGYEIIKFENGVATTIGTKAMFNFDNAKYYKLSVDVSGDNITAYIDGEKVFSNINIGTVLTRGSVGARVYSGNIMIDDIVVSIPSLSTYFGQTKLVGTNLSTTLINNSAAKNVLLISAIYENDSNGIGKLLSVNEKQVSLQDHSQSIESMTLDIPNGMTEYCVKVYLFDNFENIKPLSGFLKGDF